MNSLIWIASGLAAGALARIVLREQSRGFVGDVVLGALGSVTGAWLLRLVHGVAPPGILAQVLTAVMGAIALVSMGRLVMSAARTAGVTSARVGTTLTDLDSQVRRLTELERTVLSGCSAARPVRSIPTSRSVSSRRSASGSPIASPRSAAAGRSSACLPRSCSGGCSSTPSRRARWIRIPSSC